MEIEKMGNASIHENPITPCKSESMSTRMEQDKERTAKEWKQWKKESTHPGESNDTKWIGQHICQDGGPGIPSSEVCMEAGMLPMSDLQQIYNRQMVFRVQPLY